jgi:hypothetical protein
MAQMMVRASLAALVVLVSLTAQAEHAVAPEAGAVAAATREICTEIAWGYDGVRTDCRFKVLAAEAPNPALNGLCTTYYGRRTCH